MLFKHSHTKYTVSVLSTSLPHWHDIKYTKYKWVAEKVFNKYKKIIDPRVTHLCLTKLTIYGNGSMIRTEELACVGAKVNEIIREG